MNTPTQFMGEIRPNSAAIPFKKFGDVTCQLEQIGAVLRQLLNKLAQSELSQAGGPLAQNSHGQGAKGGTR